jgi:16S rRNA (uracil1498-N3)-methyltransferase
MKEGHTFTWRQPPTKAAKGLHILTFPFTFIPPMAAFRAFLFPDATLEGDSLTLDARESHHLIRVLRAKSGDSVFVLDGKGRRYTGSIVRADAKGARVKVDVVEQAERPAWSLTLLQSIPKGKAMDLILRMATEIGATCVQPVFTDQGEVQIKGDRLASKMDKWRTTMIESCKQCGLAYLPTLARPLSLYEWLATRSVSSGELRIVASLEGDSRPLLKVVDGADALSDVVAVVGPEGDFTDDEYCALRAAGFKAVRLGANVLRAETAAAYILSVVDQSMSARSPES